MIARDCRSLLRRKTREAAHPFDQRSDVRLAEFLAELDQVAFPVSELLSVPNNIRTMQNAQFRAEATAMTPPDVPPPASGAALRKMRHSFSSWPAAE